MLDTANGQWQRLLEERYGAKAVPDVQRLDVLQAMLTHRSVRAYSDRALPENTVETMVAAAQSASTSSNLQTWSVVAVEDEARKKALSELAGNQKHIIDAPLQMVWLADLSRLYDAALAGGIEARGVDYFEAFLVAAVDAALASQNAAVAAEALGLGIVYIGGMRNQPEKVAEILELPPLTFAVFGMCVGYPSELKPAHIKPRLAQEAVLHRETYSKAGMAEKVADYDALMSAFYASQNPKNDVWSLHSGKRVVGPERLSGRDRLKEALNNLGFKLL